ncbi:MAG TPA: lipoprotein-releasing ABC transporter permease subunit [Gammaproteobacteria bacterium]
MFYPLETFIALRYVRARRRRGVAAFITTASVLGMAIGVAALIVVLSIMNGLESELRTRLLSMTAHATVSDSANGVEDWRLLRDELADIPGVAGISPYVLVEGMLGSGSNLMPAIVRGILPDEEAAVSNIAELLSIGSLNDLEAGSQRIVLGEILAINLGVGVGNRVNLLIPEISNERPAAVLRSFLVAGVFSAGSPNHDSGLALVHLDDASELRGYDGRAGGIAIRLDDPMAVGEFARAIPAAVLARGQYSDWTIENRSYFRAVRIEKTMMALLLTLIVAVAAFNIVASLVMVVTDKKKDIAILRTYGLAPNRVSRIFVVQGMLIGVVGTTVGLVLGLMLAFNVQTILPWLERNLNFELLPGDVYYVTELPSEVHWLDVTSIGLVAFAIAIVATIYPSRRAASVAPAEALRYE